MKLTKEEFDNLYSDTITKKEYDAIIDKIDDRFYEVMKILSPELSWVDYANGYDEIDGHFDPEAYKNAIPFEGSGIKLPEVYQHFYEIPTRWLWEDVEQIIKEDTKKILKTKAEKEAKDKANKEKRKAEKERIWNSIKSKLNQEEIKYVLSFKK